MIGFALILIFEFHSSFPELSFSTRCGCRTWLGWSLAWRRLFAGLVKIICSLISPVLHLLLLVEPVNFRLPVLIHILPPITGFFLPVISILLIYISLPVCCNRIRRHTRLC